MGEPCRAGVAVCEHVLLCLTEDEIVEVTSYGEVVHPPKHALDLHK